MSAYTFDGVCIEHCAWKDHSNNSNSNSSVVALFSSDRFSNFRFTLVGTRLFPETQSTREKRRTWGAPVEGLPKVDLLHGACEEGGEGVPVFPPGHVGKGVGAIQLHDPILHSDLLSSTVILAKDDVERSINVEGIISIHSAVKLAPRRREAYNKLRWNQASTSSTSDIRRHSHFPPRRACQVTHETC